jgi:hypothetical protein
MRSMVPVQWSASGRVTLPVMLIDDAKAAELAEDLATALGDFASSDPLIRLAGCAEVLDVLRRTQDLLREANNAGGTPNRLH